MACCSKFCEEVVNQSRGELPRLANEAPLQLASTTSLMADFAQFLACDFECTNNF